jgi:Serine dehydrogenase proteinase
MPDTQADKSKPDARAGVSSEHPEPDRVASIRRLEEVIRAPVIAYVTNTRPGLEAQMAIDAIRFVYEHVRILREKLPVLALFIHSNGGDGTVPWKLVTLLREYCDKLVVLVPHRAFSAATLTAIGADEIYMHPMGMLGPTDPSITGPYNPPDPLNPANKLPISVEEVLAYIALIKEDVGINHEEELVQAFNQLPAHVHPIALGSVKRSHSQSRMMAKKLMKLIKPAIEEHRIDEIVGDLTSKLYYHGHPINRSEAAELGLKISPCSADLERTMWNLYEGYEDEMEMLKPFNPAHQWVQMNRAAKPAQPVLSTIPTKSLVAIESRARLDALTLDIQIFGVKDQNGAVNTQVYINRQGWQHLR